MQLQQPSFKKRKQMKTTRLILVGGFLGSGKTTLLWEAAQLIMKEGKQTALITNDQAPELVDTALLMHNKLKVAEVSGSCFCCNFTGLIAALRNVRDEANADVIIAEPVGSCTDLSATIIQPLKENMKREIQTSPLSVLADPFQLEEILNGKTAGLHPSAAYIFKKQLEESDLILISKTDLTDANSLLKLVEQTKINYPQAEVKTISSKTGEGIAEWLQLVMNSNESGKQLAAVDYDIYAEGEAVLGWLNSTTQLTGNQVNWDAFANELMSKISQEIAKENASIGHVKFMIEQGENYLIGNLTGQNHNISFRGFGGTGNQAKLTMNARVEMSPKQLENIIEKVLNDISIQSKIRLKKLTQKCIRPGRPNPTYRYRRVYKS